MKDYGLKRKRLHEAFKYRAANLRSFLAPYFTFNKEKRNRKKYYYDWIFKKQFAFRHRDLAIPKDKYCVPIGIITSDLILREDISNLKAGLSKLLKRHLSHKFVNGLISPEEILDHIDRMDSVLTSSYSFINVGVFDFDGSAGLQEKISHFDLCFRNVNPSYIAMEVCIYLTDEYQQELADMIGSDFVAQRGHAISSLIRNQKPSGGKRGFTIVHYSEAQLKSDAIYESIVSLKWKFYQKICSFFTPVLHQMDVCPPSINVYMTDIHYSDKSATDFWESMGIFSHEGQFVDESRKLFFTTVLSQRYEHQSHFDLAYVVNAETVRRENGYYSLEFQIVYEAKELLAASVFRFALLAAFNEYASKKVVVYKLKLNKIKLKKNRLNRLLKLRYTYEKNLDAYVRYIQDNIWELPRKEIASAFSHRTLKYACDYRVLTESPLITKDEIVKQIENLRADFDSKTNILRHLAEYENEKKSRYVNYTMLIIAVATLILVIFPNLSGVVAQRLQGILEWVLIQLPK